MKLYQVTIRLFHVMIRLREATIRLRDVAIRLFSGLRSDVGHVPGLPVVAHHAVALEDGPFLDDEGRCIDVAVDLTVAVDLDALGGDDLSDDGATDGDAADVEVTFDRRALADDQLVLRCDLAVELAVDAHRVLEFELALEGRAAIEKPIQ